MQMKQRTITLQEAAKVYGARPQVLRDLRQQGCIHGEKIGKHIYLRVVDLERMFYGVKCGQQP
jgi:hypothetical protein